MRIVVALGGNALLRRGQPMTAENQRENVRVGGRRARADRGRARARRSPTATARRSGCWRSRAPPTTEVETYPLDVLGAQTEGMIGYMIEQELGNLLPFEKPFATHPDDDRGRPGRSGLRGPDQVHRPGLRQGRGRAAGRREGLGDQARRRQVAARRRLAAARSASSRSGPIRWLLEHGAVVICTGGGGIPTMYEPGTRTLVGRGGRHRQGPRQRAARARARGRPVRDGDRRRRASTATGARRSRRRSSGRRRASSPARRSPRARWARRSRRPSTSSEQTGKRAAIGTLAEVGGLVAGTHGHHRRPLADPVSDPLSTPTRAAARRAVREPHARGSRCSRSRILIVLISTTVAAVRHGCDRRTAPGRAAPQRRSAPGCWRCASGNTSAADPGRGDRRRLVGDGRDLHPARGRRPDRHLEHGRARSRRRLLRHRRSSSRTVFYLSAVVICGLVGLVDRQLVDDRGDARRRRSSRWRRCWARPRSSRPAPSSPGAYFGDKMTPLSETTVLVPSMVGGVTTQQHIGAMIWTSGPAILIALGAVHDPRPGRASARASPFDRAAAQATLAGEFNITPPQPAADGAADHPVAAAGAAVPGDPRRAPCSPACWPGSPSRSSCVAFAGEAGVAGDGHQGALRGDGQRVRRPRPASSRSTTLFSRGGMSSMLTTIWLILGALSYAAIVESAGFLGAADRAGRARARSRPARCIAAVIVHGDRAEHHRRRPVRRHRHAQPRLPARVPRSAASRRGCCRAPSRTPAR